VLSYRPAFWKHTVRKCVTLGLKLGVINGLLDYINKYLHIAARTAKPHRCILLNISQAQRMIILRRKKLLITSLETRTQIRKTGRKWNELLSRLDKELYTKTLIYVKHNYIIVYKATCFGLLNGHHPAF